MDTTWRELGGRLAARRAELGLTQLQVASASGTSESTIRSLESGRTDRKPRPSTLRAIAVALQWTPGSVELVLAGRDPIEASNHDDNGGGLAARVAELERRLADVLATLRAQNGETAAGYDVDLDDPEERDLWALTTIPEVERWALVEHLRELRAEGRRSG